MRILHYTESMEKPTNENQDAQKTEHSALSDVGDKTNAKLHSLENQFVSLSSQRQLSFIIGALFLLSAFTGGLGFLIALGLGVLMIFQGVSGKMLLNDFLDKMDQKHKKWLVPGLIGAVALTLIISMVMGWTQGSATDNPRAQHYQQR